MAENFDHTIRIGRHASGTGAIGIEPPPPPDIAAEIDEAVQSTLGLAESRLAGDPRPHHEITFYAERDSARVAVAEQAAAVLVRHGLTVGIDTHIAYMGYGATVLEAHNLDQRSGWRDADAAIITYQVSPQIPVTE
jgi:hypothetical protein